MLQLLFMLGLSYQYRNLLLKTANTILFGESGSTETQSREDVLIGESCTDFFTIDSSPLYGSIILIINPVGNSDSPSSLYIISKGLTEDLKVIKPISFTLGAKGEKILVQWKANEKIQIKRALSIPIFSMKSLLTPLTGNTFENKDIFRCSIIKN